MATSDDLRQIFSAGRPLIEDWLDIGEQIAALRDVAASKGLDWSQLKALMKAQVQDERDETGNGKRVARIVEKAEFASAYADMLGLASANMNENNFSAGQSYAEVKGVDAKLVATVATGMQTEIGRKALVAALDVMIERADAETGEILTQEQPVEPATKSQPVVTGHIPDTNTAVGLAGPALSHDGAEANTKPAENPHSPASPSQALQADKTSEAVVPPASSLVPNSAMSARTKGDVIRLMRPFCAHADDLGKCGGQGTKHCNDCEQIKRTASVSA